MLLIIVAVQLNGGFFTIISFKLNQDYIKTNLCEKKRQSFEATICAGSCYLKKQLQDNQKKESPLSNKIKLFYDLVYLIPVDSFNSSVFYDLENESHCFYLSIPGNTFITEVFHPPC